jgi:PAS domain S-box-containing protein
LVLPDGEVAGTLCALDPSSAALEPEAVADPTALASLVAFKLERDRRFVAERETADAKYRAVVESAGDAIVTIGADGRVAGWNPAAARVFGRRAEEIVGRPLAALIPERFRDAHAAGVTRLAGGGAPSLLGRTVEVAALRRDGTEFPIELSLTSWQGKDGHFFTAVIRDVSERHATRAKLETHAERLRTIVATQTELVAAQIEPGTLLQVVADRMRDISGADGTAIELVDGSDLVMRAASGIADAHVGMRLPMDSSLAGLCARTGEVVRCDDTEADARVHRANARRIGVRSMLAVPLRHRTETVGVLKVYGLQPNAFTDQDASYLQLIGAPIGSALSSAATLEAERALAAERAVALDTMREAKEAADTARAAAEEANAVKSAFLLTMSHELRTPLNAIIGYGQLLLDGLSGPLLPEQEADVALIARAGDRLLGLVEDVLDLSRIEAGQIALEPEAVDLGKVIDEVCAEVIPRAAAKGLEVAIDVAPDLHLRADRRRLGQVIANLLDNAVKFTEQGEVRVGARGVPRGIEVVVADSGIGIAPGETTRIFDPFQQADGSTTRRHGGLGLGLAIAQKLTECHGGTIRVESEPGAGSVFTFTLPAAS